MTDAQDLPNADVEIVTGEVVEFDDIQTVEIVDEFEIIELDDSGILEVDDGFETDGDQTDGDQTDGDARTEVDGGVMVLDTWQIQIPATGDERVDAALARLTEVEGLPPGQHAEVYESVHAGLQDALADLDQA